MKIYEAIEKIEKENGTPLFRVSLDRKEGGIIKTYEGDEIKYLRNWIWEVAGYEVINIRTIGVSGAIITIK